jgi:acyl-CoA synthetase (AMP-forming)/AMP-acid ligase II
MMNLSSIKIFPAEIEQVLEQHPAVKNAAAFAFRSTAYGDIPVAAVESNESPKARRDELMAYVRRQLGARAPSMIFIVDALPRNAAGKVVKRDLPGLVAARPKTE